MGDVRRRLSELADRLADPTPVFERIGARLVESTEARFDAFEGPDGRPWPPLAEKTRRYKPKHKDRPLTLEGDLRGSFSAEADRAGLVVGSDRPYAATHQFGRAESNIPARPFLGLTAEDIARIEKRMARGGKTALRALAAAGAAAAAVGATLLHPHQQVYFNGLEDRTTPWRLRDRYDFGYWGPAFRAGL